MNQLSTFCLRPLLLFALVMPVSGRDSAQEIDRIALREATRRQCAITKGDAALNRAKTHLARGNVAKANREFRAALKMFPNTIVSEQLRKEAINGLCISGIQLAKQKVAKGHSKEAAAMCREILSPRYDPSFRPAVELLVRLQQPVEFSQRQRTGFVAKVEEVKGLLEEAGNYYNTGRFDLAFRKYDQVLILDPYNVAARRGQERINLAKIHYGNEAVNETRSRQLEKVQNGWEGPVREFGQIVGSSSESRARDTTGKARINNKLNTIIVPR